MEALYPKDKKILVIGKIGKRSLEAAEALFEAGFSHVCELRPGYKGIIGNDGHYAETGWEGLGLDSEQTADGNSYLDMIGRAGD